MDRRILLAGCIAATSSSLLMVARPGLANAAATAAVPMPDFSGIKTADQFFMSVLPRAEASLTTSKKAVESTKNRNANEFAGFELGEAITVNMVLKDIVAKGNAGDDSLMAIVEQINSAKGDQLDKAYITFQLQNHEYLRDLADAYLQHSAGAADPMEKQGRHMASLMLAVFKEHVAICKRISSELSA